MFLIICTNHLTRPFIFTGEKDGATAPDNYQWRDFYIGLELNVYARTLRIVDADRGTRQFYSENYDPLDDAEPMPDNFGKSVFEIYYEEIYYQEL